jgi:hypothetical protein
MSTFGPRGAAVAAAHSRDNSTKKMGKVVSHQTYLPRCSTSFSLSSPLSSPPQPASWPFLIFYLSWLLHALLGTRLSMRGETEIHFSERGAIMQPQSLSSGRRWGAKLFANSGGRVANPFRNVERIRRDLVYFPHSQGRKKMISKTSPGRSKIIIEHEDHIKYWTRHFGVTKDELTRAIGLDGAIDHSGKREDRDYGKCAGRKEAAQIAVALFPLI